MPFVTVDNTRLFYRLEGKAGRLVLILSHSIGADHSLWAPQVADLQPYFQILRYDTRGHGASDAPAGEYTIDRLGRDVLGLADFLGISKFNFCGLSLGGAVGQWLALNASDRLTALVLANTSPQFATRDYWQARIQAVVEGGMAAIGDIILQRSFSPETVARGEPYAQALKAVTLGTNPIGYAGCCAVLRDIDYRERLREIKVSTLVIAGDLDISTPWAGHGEKLAHDIPGARAVRLPTAHLSNLERPRSFTAALLDFLQPPPETYADPLDDGFAVRRAVLGEAYVDRATAAANDLTREFQQMITRYAWGTIWTRPGLDRRTRRLLVLAIAASLGRWEEFSLHVRTGLAHELELCDLKEVLLQTAIYAGVPTANTGFHIANQIADEIAAQESGKAQSTQP